MELIIQLGMVIGIIALAFFLFEKVAKVFLRVIIVICALFFIISSITLFSTYSQLREMDTDEGVFAALEKDGDIAALFFIKGEVFEAFDEEETLRFGDSPEDFGEKKDRKIVLKEGALWQFNKSRQQVVEQIYDEPSYEERSRMLKEEYFSFIDETSFMQMSYLYFSKNIMIIPERRFLRAWLVERPMAWASGIFARVK